MAQEEEVCAERKVVSFGKSHKETETEKDKAKKQVTEISQPHSKLLQTLSPYIGYASPGSTLIGPNHYKRVT